jgi:23S rRNA pseudouridine955/2504/2580 synthase
MKTHRVPRDVAGMPAYRYVRRAWPLLPERRVREAFERRDVKLNGARAAREDLVRGGDEMILYIEDALFSGGVRVLFDDGRLLAVEKPAGLPVDADRDGVGADTLLVRVRDLHPSARLCHRLDTDTGGAMLLSLDEGTHDALLAAFKRGEVEKQYRAIALGDVAERASLKGYLTKDADAGKVRVSDRPSPGAQTVLTEYRALNRNFREGLSYIEIEIKTGKTHQIRAHLASVGCPLLGDDKYGDRALNKRLKVQKPCLWCVSLALTAYAPYAGMRFESMDPYRKDAQ